MLPYPACQLPITACSVRCLRELPWVALVYVVCQAQHPIPPARPRSGPNEGAHGKILVGWVPSGMFFRQGSHYF